MKKFYASLLSLALVSSMTLSAKVVGGVDIDFSNPIPFQKKSITQKTKMGTATNLDVNPRVNAPSRAESDEWEVVGEAYFEESIFGPSTSNVTLERNKTNPDIYRVPDAWAYFTEDPQPFIFDASNPDCVIIEDQYTGVYFEYYGSEALIFSYSFYYITNGGTVADFMADFADYNITLVDGVLHIPAQAILLMVPDSELEDSDGPVNQAIFYGNSSEMVLAFPDSGYVPTWKTIGEGEFQDGMVSPFFGYTGENNQPYPVTVQAGNLDENQGWYNFPDAWSVWGLGNPLTIDASVPECVQVPIQYFVYAGSSYGDMYLLSLSYNLVGSDACPTWEDFVAAYPESNIVLEDNVIEIPANSVFYYFPDKDPSNLYGAKDPEAGYITLPASGISDVKADVDSTAVYYNLQGVQIANPQPGNLYIVKQGSKASKIMMR